MGVSEITDTLLGVLIIRASYYLEYIFGVPYFRKPPSGNQCATYRDQASPTRPLATTTKGTFTSKFQRGTTFLG